MIRLKKVFTKRWRLILTITVLFMLSTFIYCLSTKPLYRGSTHWVVRKYHIDPFSDVYELKETFVDDLLVEASILRSPYIVNQILKKCKLPYSYSQFLMKYLPQPYLNSSEIRIYYESHSSEEVYNVLKAVKPIFEDYMRRFESDQYAQNKIFIDDYFHKYLIGAAQQSLNELEQYEKQLQMVSVDKKAEEILKVVTIVSNSLDDLKLDLNAVKQRQVQNKKLLGVSNVKALKEKLALSTDPGLAELLSAQVANKVELIKLNAQYKENEQAIQQLKMAMKDRQELIKEKMEQILEKKLTDKYVATFIPLSGIHVNLANDIVLDEIKMNSLVNNINTYSQILTKEKAKLETLPDIKFNHTWRRLYNKLNWGLVENNRFQAFDQDMKAKLSQNSYKIYELSKNFVSDNQYKPNYWRSLLNALVFGALLGIMYSYGLESRAGTLTYIDEVLELENIKRFKIPAREAHLVFSDNFKLVNSNISYNALKLAGILEPVIASGYKTHTILSDFTHSEGAFYNLCTAKMFADNGYKTLFMDLDFMRFSNFYDKLSDFTDLEQKGLFENIPSFPSLSCAKSTLSCKLWYMYPQQTVLDSGSVFDHPQLYQLLEHVSRNFDRVVINLPPLKFFNTALPVLHTIETKILAVKQNITRHTDFNTTLNHLYNFNMAVFLVLLIQSQEI